MYGGRARPRGHCEHSAGGFWNDKELLTKLGMEPQQGRDNSVVSNSRGIGFPILKGTGFVPICDDLHRLTDQSPNYTGGDV